MTPALATPMGPQPSTSAPRPLSRVRGRAGEGAAPGTAPAAQALSPSLPAPGISPSLTLPRFAGEGIAARPGAAARLIEVR